MMSQQLVFERVVILYIYILHADIHVYIYTVVPGGCGSVSILLNNVFESFSSIEYVSLWRHPSKVGNHFDTHTHTHIHTPGEIG